MKSKKLPSESPIRWTKKRKINIILSIISGEICIEDSIKKYGLSNQEIGEWWNILIK
jgi:hypothetical protein